MFVIYEVSLPVYVKLAHFCVGRGVTCFLVLRGFVWAYRKGIIV